MILLNLFKIIFLFIFIVYGFTNIGKLIHKQYISATHILLMSFGLTGFIYLQWIM